jgi:hypothetical protein
MFRVDLARALVVSILLWRDSVAATTKFPSVRELVRIELGRILTHPSIAEAFQGFRAKLGVLYNTLAIAEPWDIHTSSVLRAFESRFAPSELEVIGRAMAASAHHDNAAFDMIMRNGKQPSATPERIIETCEGVARVLGIPGHDREIESAVRETYFAIYRQVC